MRTAGKLLILLGIIILIIVAALAALGFAASFFGDSSDAVGFVIILSLFFGIPAAIVAAILILIGAVLFTSAPKPDVPAEDALPAKTAPKQPEPGRSLPMNRSRYVQTRKAPETASAPEDSLRAAMRTSTRAVPSPNRTVAIILRILAIALFAWSFLPDAIFTIRVYSGFAPYSSALAIVLLRDFVASAILPLILWLLSNVIMKHLPNMSRARPA